MLLLLVQLNYVVIKEIMPIRRTSLEPSATDKYYSLTTSFNNIITRWNHFISQLIHFPRLLHASGQSSWVRQGQSWKGKWLEINKHQTYNTCLSDNISWSQSIFSHSHLSSIDHMFLFQDNLHLWNKNKSELSLSLKYFTGENHEFFQFHNSSFIPPPQWKGREGLSCWTRFVTLSSRNNSLLL